MAPCGDFSMAALRETHTQKPTQTHTVKNSLFLLVSGIQGNKVRRANKTKNLYSFKSLVLFCSITQKSNSSLLPHCWQGTRPLTRLVPLSVDTSLTVFQSTWSDFSWSFNADAMLETLKTVLQRDVSVANALAS